MDPVMTDRCVKMALSDAFGRCQYHRTLPTPFANARWGLPCHFQRSGRDEWVHFTNPEYGCHRQFSLKAAWFWRGKAYEPIPVGASIQRYHACMAALIAANPLNPAHPVPFPLETVFAKEKFKGHA